MKKVTNKYECFPLNTISTSSLLRGMTSITSKFYYMVIIMKDEDFTRLVEEFPEGVVVMNGNRKIMYLNKKAYQMTGWRPGEFVPYCSYCQLREVSMHEERCILANDNGLPSFRSHMPNYVDTKTDFEMSMSNIEFSGKPCKVLVIRNPCLNSHEDTVRTQELLIHETMLAQENERKRIARELHDHIGQSIYSIFLGLEGIKRHCDNPEYHERLKKITGVMEDTLQALRDLTTELRPHLYDILGFETALRSSIEDWTSIYKIDFSLNIHIPDNLKFEKEEGLHLYRIIQEAVNNAVRHGKADKIKIDIYSSGKEVYFQISDNGIGFDIENITSSGVGLKHMRERVKMFNGDIKFISQQGSPTRIEGYLTIDETPFYSKKALKNLPKLDL